MNLFRRYKLHVVFFALALLHLYALVSNFQILRFLTKPLICLALIYLLFKTTALKRDIEKIVAGGLLFGCLGDTFLMLQDQFVLGLASFLIGHVLFSIAFIKQSRLKHLGNLRGSFVVVCILTMFSYYLFTLLQPSLGPLKIPVILYIVVISLMAIFAFTRKQRVGYWSFIVTFIAALLFIISDSILAINKFVIYIANADLMVMSTYILSQYGITVGIIIDNPKRLH